VLEREFNELIYENQGEGIDVRRASAILSSNSNADDLKNPDPSPSDGSPPLLSSPPGGTTKRYYKGYVNRLFASSMKWLSKSPIDKVLLASLEEAFLDPGFGGTTDPQIDAWEFMLGIHDVCYRHVKQRLASIRKTTSLAGK
jgi:hypothetical protein